jgi:hypothetical protein
VNEPLFPDSSLPHSIFSIITIFAKGIIYPAHEYLWDQIDIKFPINPNIHPIVINVNPSDVGYDKVHGSYKDEIYWTFQSRLSILK